jgi:hypothetical protein
VSRAVAIAVTGLLAAGAQSCHRTVRVDGPTPVLPSPVVPLNTLVRGGCYLCLADAVAAYGKLSHAGRSDDATVEAAGQAALLFLIRQKELGIPDAARVAAAAALARAHKGSIPDGELVLDALDALPVSTRGLGEEAPTGPEKTDPASLITSLANVWQGSEAGAYAYLSLFCSRENRLPGNVEQIVAFYPRSDSIRYRAATCAASNGDVLRALLAANPRFHEIEYSLGLSALNSDSDGSEYFKHAWRGIPTFTSARLAAAQSALVNDEFELCLNAANDVLRIVPSHAGAKILVLEALSRLGRPVEAVALAKTLTTGTWYLGDAQYWLAWNELSLGQLNAARAAAIAAQAYGATERLWVLTGRVRAAQHDFSGARDAFDEALTLDRGDCDARYYRADALGSIGAPSEAQPAFLSAAECYAARSAQYMQDIDVASAVVTDPAAQRRLGLLLKRDAEATRMERECRGRAKQLP